MDYEPDDEDREVFLKTEKWLKASEIPKILRNKMANEAVKFYIHFKRFGMPYINWAENPNKLIDIVDVLEPLDYFYHPRMI